MPLAARLLFALGLLAALVTALVGLSARDVARREVDLAFEQRIAAASRGTREVLVWEAARLNKTLHARCRYDPAVDRSVVDLEAAGGDVARMSPGGRIAIQALVQQQRLALSLDELSLVTAEGVVLGSSLPERVGRQEPELARLLADPTARPRLVGEGAEAAIELHCARSSSGVTVGLVGSRKIGPLLDRIGEAQAVRLTLASGEPEGGADGGATTLRKRLAIPEIDGLEVTATIDRGPLVEALRKIDRVIFLTGAIAVLVSIALAVFIASGLSRPIAELAQQTREVVRGRPRAVRGRGGRELSELARSFNQTIDELTAMRKRLARTERIAARREIARQVAHEIKNPLAPIRAAVETLRRLRARHDPEFNAYFDEATATVLAEVHRIQEIVTEFTKFARMPPPELRRVDLRELATSVAGLHDARADTGGIRVRVEAEDVPEVLGDRDQLVQVLTNLVQNAIEAIRSLSPPPDRPKVVIDLGMASAERVRIGVEDDGPGVDPGMRERLFQPYATKKRHGTGLGLAIVARIVHEHGGEIALAESVDGGARFEISLPVDGPPPLEQPPPSSGGGKPA